MPPSPTPLRSYVGILNQGSTCYLNSVIQALFHLPYFRYQIYNIRELQQNPLAVELRNIFAQLDACSADITTLELTRAFGWNAYETSFQHDVHEMVQQLFDCLETTLKDTPHANFIRDLFSGFLAFRSRIVDGSGDYVADRLQRFYDVELVVKDKHNMDESLRELVTPEKIDGVRLELHPGAPATTHNIERTQRFVQLPPVLLIHPNRAAFDMETGEPITLGNRWSFAADIDLAPYVTDARELRLDAESAERMQQMRESSGGLCAGNDNEEEEEEAAVAAQQLQSQQSQAAGASSQTPLGVQGRQRALGTRYRLRAILTHAGSINIGHYYTYINFRNNSNNKTDDEESSSSNDNKDNKHAGAAASRLDDMGGDDGSGGGTWLRFNDELVEVASAQEVQRSAFGESVGSGDFASGAALPSPSPHSYFRNERASLLVYVNVDCEQAVLCEHALPPPEVLALVEKLAQQRAPAVVQAPAVERTVRYFCCEDVVDLLDEVPQAMQRARVAPLLCGASDGPFCWTDNNNNSNNKDDDDDDDADSASRDHRLVEGARMLKLMRRSIAAHLGLGNDVRRLRLLCIGLVPNASEGVTVSPVTASNVGELRVFVAHVLPHAPPPPPPAAALAHRHDGAAVAYKDGDADDDDHHHHHHRHSHHHHHDTAQPQQATYGSKSASTAMGSSSSSSSSNSSNADATAPFLALLRGIRDDGSFVLPVRVAHSRAALTQLVEQYIRDEAHGVTQRLYRYALGHLHRVHTLDDVPDGANLLLCPRTLTAEQVQEVMQTRQYVPKQVMLVDHHNMGVYTPLYTDAVSDYTPYSVMQARVYAWLSRHATALCPPSADHIAFHYAHAGTGQASVMVARPTRHSYDGEVQEEEISRLCAPQNNSNNNNNNNGSGSSGNDADSPVATSSSSSPSSPSPSPTMLLYCSILPRPLHALNVRVLVRFNAGWGAQPCVYVGKHVQQLTLDALVTEALTQIRSDCVSRELRMRCVRARHDDDGSSSNDNHSSSTSSSHSSGSGNSSSSTSDSTMATSATTTSPSEAHAQAQQQQQQQLTQRLPVRLLQVQGSRIAGVISDARQLVDLTPAHQYVLDPLSPALPGYEVIDVQFCSRRSSGEVYFGTPTNISVTCDMQETGHNLLLRVAKKLKVPDAEAVVHKWIICVKGLRTGTIRTAGKRDILASLVKEVGGKPYGFLVDRPQVVALDGVEDERKDQAIVIRSSSTNELSSL